MNKTESIKAKQINEAGFSLLELLVVMTILLIVLALVSSVFTSSLGMRKRESQKNDALTSVQAAINVMSREIANSGYGLKNNGIVLDKSNENKVHFRANIENDDLKTNDIGEEIIYYFDPEIDSVVRYDRFATPDTSIVINRVANVTFEYLDFVNGNSTPTKNNIPSNNTGRIKITLMVQMDNIEGQPQNQNISMTTEVSLKNSVYMLNQY